MQENFNYIGIDPGKKGALAIIKNGEISVFPYDSAKYIEILSDLVPSKSFCILEKVGARPGQGVTSMFSFGENYGFIRGVLEALKIPYELVPPKKWKKIYSINSDKSLAIDVAVHLFPGVDMRISERARKPNDGIAEALLMAEYGRRNYGK